MCLIPSILLPIVIYHIYDRNFLGEKVEEVWVLGAYLFSEKVLMATYAQGVYHLASQHCALCLQSPSKSSSFYSSGNSLNSSVVLMLLSACF